MAILDQLPAPALHLAAAGMLYLALAAHFMRTRWRIPAGERRANTGQHGGMSGLERGSIAVVLAMHAVGLNFALFPEGGMRFSFALALSAMMWMAAVAYWLEGFRTRIDSLQPVVLALAALAVVAPLLFPRTHVLEHARSMAFRLHFLSAMLAYSLFALAALHAGLMAVVERQLHRRAPSAALAGAPPLLALESLVFRMVTVAFVLLTLAVGSGVLSSESIYGRPFSLDHKTIFALVSWLLVAVLLAGRQLRGWRGRTALRWLLASFVALLLAYIGSSFVAEILLGR